VKDGASLEEAAGADFAEHKASRSEQPVPTAKHPAPAAVSTCLGLAKKI